MERRWSLHAVKMNGSSRSYINELWGQKADEADLEQTGADKKSDRRNQGAVMMGRGRQVVVVVVVVVAVEESWTKTEQLNHNEAEQEEKKHY